jgi:radical SAM superfamily enzyme YgiQ (UPF0313 family)
MREKYREQLLREEHGSLYKPGASVKVALVFPNSYYLGMSSLGFQVILDEINTHPDVSCERVFFDPNKSDEMPRSLETRRPLSEFDIVSFSISFELDYFNVVKILHAAGIPPISKERCSLAPLVIAGGICPSFNPEPLSGFVDAFVIGDGEEAIHSLIFEYQNWRQTRHSPRDLLHKLSGIKGVYIPSLYEVAYKDDGTLSGIHPQPGVKSEIEKSSVSDLNRYDTASKILTPNTEFPNTFLVEVARGCAHRCRFCVASYVQGCRIRSRDSILKLAQSHLAQSAEKIGLLGSSVADHPQIDEIAMSLVSMGKKLSIASMRADSVSDALLDALAASGQNTITLAPESASKRLQEVIGKNISLASILEVIRSALKKGILNVRLYFMVGLPTETQEDVNNIVTLVECIRRVMLDYSHSHDSSTPRLTVSISPFVPKPHTPFQWCQMERRSILSRKLQFIRQELGKIGGIRVPSSSARWSAIQGVLSRGDRRLVNVLLDVAQKSTPWNQALKKNGLSQDYYLHRARGLDELFPWDHLNLGISRSRLAEQRSLW